MPIHWDMTPEEIPDIAMYFDIRTDEQLFDLAIDLHQMGWRQTQIAWVYPDVDRTPYETLCVMGSTYECARYQLCLACPLGPSSQERLELLNFCLNTLRENFPKEPEYPL